MMKRSILVTTTISVAGLLCLGCTLSAPVFADGNAGAGGSESATNPTSCGTQHVGTCHGGGWTYHTSTEDPITIAGMSGTGYSFPGGTINGCGSVGGYYRSAWFNQGDSANLVGLAANSEWSPNGGPSTYNTAAVPLASVQEAFSIADAAGVVPDGVTWDNVGWFCYSDSLKKKKGQIHSRAKVSVNTDVYNLSEESDLDSFVGIQISTDQPSVDVTFEHTFYFTPDGDYDFSGDDYTFNEAYRFNGPTNKTWSHAVGNDVSELKESHTVTISLEPGESSGQVCRTVSNYKTKLTFKYDGTVKYNGPTASSRACITVTRPDDPGPGSTGATPITSGSGTAPMMFAGESSQLAWNVKAKGVKTRRLKALRVISYMLGSDVNYTNGIVSGASRSGSEPCAYINGKVANVWSCGIVKQNSGDTITTREQSWDTSATDSQTFTYNQSQSIIVPEQYNTSTSIGAKYCTTAGYKFEYWYAIAKASSGPSGASYSWHHVDGKDYWYIFESACAPIAKRPQFSVQNGSVFSRNGINTSFSTRYANTDMGMLLSQGGSRTGYGSWVEYLGVANGTIKGFASGSSLYRGSSNLAVKKDNNSSLTIANNTDNLGSAGITPNGSLSSRMGTYLKEKASSSTATTLGETSVSSTDIRHYTGNLDITGNITATTGSVALNGMPQMVIFVDGDLNIASSVTRIDAWLVVNGTLNTCKEFTSTTGAGDADCSSLLVFNGPVNASNLKLNRTYGAEYDSKATPSEVFKFSPGTYIWAYQQSINGSDGGYRYTDSYSRELAPRN